ncbi:hypothetical protein [Nocardia gipuzkoensis]
MMQFQNRAPTLAAPAVESTNYSHHAVAGAPAVSLYGAFGTSGCGHSAEPENFVDAVRGDFSAGKGTWCINEGQAGAILALRRFVDVELTIVGAHLTY